jgi:hypothetical protein
MSTPNDNNNNSYNKMMRLPTISTNPPSTSSLPSSSASASHPTIYEISESELASMQTDHSWRQQQS